MKLIEALKKVKELQKKAEDLRGKIAAHSAHLSHETPVYKEQNKQVSEWLQAHSDVLKEILRLRVAIQSTNLKTNVAIQLVDSRKPITKTVAEWIHRRRDLAELEKVAWAGLTDRNLREGTIKQSTGEDLEVRIVRCYDPAERDRNLEEYDSEPIRIDSKMEIVNAVTDLIE